MRTHRVLIVVFPGVHSLDLTGPMEVFAAVQDPLVKGLCRYELRLVARTREVTCSSGLRIQTDSTMGSVRGRIDTLLVCGGEGVFDVIEDQAWMRDFARLSARASRIASVCTGAFVLAAASLLEGHRVTTHWAECERMRQRFPNVILDPDPIYIRSGNIFTSAGVTAGMDMALAMVEDDCGPDTALKVARLLVLFMKRPGGQSQFSTALQTQAADRKPIRELQAWIQDNLRKPLSIRALAKRVFMSERHFARVFVEETTLTPGRYVERVRVEEARRRLEESDDSLDQIARHCGLGSADGLRRSFVKLFGTTPSQYRARFR